MHSAGARGRGRGERNRREGVVVGFWSMMGREYFDVWEVEGA